MFKKEEILVITAAILVLSLVVSLHEKLSMFLIILLNVFLVVLINVLAKKIQAFYLETKIEFRLWEMRKFWFKSHQKFKFPLAAGILFPVIIIFLSGGYIVWMASLVFETTGKVYRAARRHGLYKMSEVSEFHIGIIAATGIIMNLLFAITGYLLNYELFATINIYYAFFNLIPFSSLDGLKIVFASKILYAVLAAIALTFLLGAALL